MISSESKGVGPIACALDAKNTETRYAIIETALQNARTDDEVIACFHEWEMLRRQIDGWQSVVNLRMRQNTGDRDRRADAERAAALTPIFSERDVTIKRLLLRRRGPLESVLGRDLLERWEADLGTVTAEVQGDLEIEQRLGDEYTVLLSGVVCDFQDGRYSLTEITRFAQGDDRAIRREAERCRWSSVNAVAAELDRIFGDLVRCRTSIAQRLGHRSFVELAYKRLGRIDYNRDDVAAFRRQILDHVVPVCAKVVERQARGLGVDCLMPWDEQRYDTLPAIRPPTSGLMEIVQSVFAEIHPAIGSFADAMVERRLFDIEPRAGKASGAFCSYLAHVGMPFVYTSPAGTAGDVASVVHEMGHAFQNFQCREFPALEFILATYETAEIHSMALEFLAWPYYERFFGNDAERYRKGHLMRLVLMLPYIAAVDHFQEAVYEKPDLSPSERHEFWRSMEALYMPWKRHGDIPALKRGARWQLQRHIYRNPFYFIDYGLAMCCALQFWSTSLKDHRSAVDAYVSLCDLGGRLPFRKLMESAGLRSPFEPGTLSEIADDAVRFLT